MVNVRDDGSVGDRMVKYGISTAVSFSEVYGKNFVVPGYAKAIDFCKHLHSKIYYCDFIGWDIAIGEDGEPMFIEMNLAPSCESVQQGCGPIFEGWILDEIMERISCVKRLSVSTEINVFKPGFDYFMQTAGEPYFMK